MKFKTLITLAFLTLTGLTTHADNMATIGIDPLTGVVTLVPRWSLGSSLAGFHHMAQDLSLGGGANQFYSIKSTSIPSGGDVAAFTRYIAASGAATNHTDIGSKLTPNSYLALTSADPDIGYGSVNFYFIHRKGTTDYFSDIVPGSDTSSAVNDLKPMSAPGGPATVTGVSGYFGLTFAAANLGYGLNLFYYLRTDPVTGFTRFGILEPALLGTSADKFDLGIAGHNALVFTGTDVGYGTDKMYYLRLDPVTGFTVLGTLHPTTGRVSDIANLGSIYSTLTFAPGDLGFGTNRFYTTGAVNPTWQSVSFAAIADRAISASSFTVTPSASSGLPIALTVAPGSTGSASISGPVAGVFTVTPTGAGIITLQATQAGQLAPVVYEANMLRQTFRVFGVSSSPDFNGDGQPDILWQNLDTGQRGVWLMHGTTVFTYVALEPVGAPWEMVAAADFNADGQCDILWQNPTTGQRGVWIMNGTVVSSYVALEPVGPPWQIAGAADFNGDNRPDILWQNPTTGQRGIWIMDGTAVSSYVALEPIGLPWQIAGAADFNGDNRPDIIWQNPTTGQRGIWIMNGTSVSTYVALDPVGPPWQIVGAADFNGDGHADILWQNPSTGQRGIWIMNGVSISTYVALDPVGPPWRMRQ